MDNQDMSKKNEGADFFRDAPLYQLTEEIQDTRTRDYVKNRLLPQMAWFNKKSREYKRQYYVLTSASIMMGAMIPVMSILLEGSALPRILIAILGASITGVNAYLSINHSRDLWLTYSSTRETLLQTLYLYFNDAGVYSASLAQEDRDKLLINVCEDELSRKNGTGGTGYYSVITG